MFTPSLSAPDEPLKVKMLPNNPGMYAVTNAYSNKRDFFRPPAKNFLNTPPEHACPFCEAGHRKVRRVPIQVIEYGQVKHIWVTVKLAFKMKLAAQHLAGPKGYLP